MKYSDLNKTQKRVVDAFIQLRPELATKSTITRPEIEDLFAKLYAQRSAGGEKIGYPMWLVKGQKVSRGVYIFPAPGASFTDAVSAVMTQKTAMSQEDKEFLAELEEAGITA